MHTNVKHGGDDIDRLSWRDAGRRKTYDLHGLRRVRQCDIDWNLFEIVPGFGASAAPQRRIAARKSQLLLIM